MHDMIDHFIHMIYLMKYTLSGVFMQVVIKILWHVQVTL